MPDSTSFTLRFTDRGGAEAALWALASALDTAGAPRPVGDDVRLAVEIALHETLVAGPRPDGAVIAVAAAAGRVALELRTGRRAAVDPDRLRQLVDEVTVSHRSEGSVLTLARSWRDGDRGS